MAKLKEIPDGVDFRKAPYRGLLTRIAKREGVTRVTIHRAIFKYKNQRIIAIIVNEIRGIQATIKDFNKVCAK